MSLRVSSVLILSGLALSSAAVAPAQEPTAAADSDRVAVLALVDSALAAISAEDFEDFADLMPHPGSIRMRIEGHGARRLNRGGTP